MRSLRVRLTLWYTSALAVVMLVSGLLIYIIVHHRLMRHHDEPLRQMAVAVEHILNEGEDCHPLSPSQVDTLNKLGKLILFHDVSRGHELFYQSPESRSRTEAPTMGVLGWVDMTQPGFETLEVHGMRWRVLSWPYQARSGRKGVIRLMQDLGDIQETLHRLRLTLLLLLPAGLGISAGGGFWLSGKALRPIDRITQMAREIEAHHLERRLPHPGVNDEIGRLVETLNGMVARLETSFSAMKRFTADASHELRSPLAIMRNTIDVVLEKPRTVEEHCETLQSLGDDVDRLRKIAEDLLLLARADAGGLAMKRETVRLDLLTQALVDTYQARAQEHDITLDFLGEEPVSVTGDERWLMSLIGNLLDNALKFTPPGGAVRVDVQPFQNRARIQVSDTGPGIPGESLERIFERFYQVDPSRSQTQGAGLGLAITAWIARSHGGTIVASNRAEGGACFVVDLPPPSVEE